MIRLWLAEAAVDGGGAAPEYISSLLQWGPAGVVIILIVSGVLVTKGHLEQTKTERDQWRAAYEKERDAHEQTRDALGELTRTSTAALETAKTTAALLTNLGHIASREPR